MVTIMLFLLLQKPAVSNQFIIVQNLIYLFQESVHSIDFYIIIFTILSAILTQENSTSFPHARENPNIVIFKCFGKMKYYTGD